MQLDNLVQKSTKEKILTTAVTLMLSKGYTATGIDEICKAAGTTKGSFFHYFASKEALGIAVLDHFWEYMHSLTHQEKFRTITDPLKLLYAYLDSFLEISKNPSISYSCLFGNFAQEISATHPAIRKRCEEGFATWENLLIQCVEGVKREYSPTLDINTKSLAQYFIATFEGTLLLAKANNDTRVVEEGIEHYKQYIQMLFAVKGGENR